MIIDFGEICRFCLTETKSGISINDKCIPEESEELAKHSIYSFVTKLDFIKVENSENLPSQVCSNCFDVIKLCYHFNQICLKSDNFLRDCYEYKLQASKEELTHKNININNETPTNKHNTKDNEVYLLDCIPEYLQSKKLNSFPVVVGELNRLKKSWQELKKSFSIFETYRQKLNSLTGKIKEAESKLIKIGFTLNENFNLVFNCEQKCSQCSLKFANSRALNFHYAANHAQKSIQTFVKFQCINCIKSFRDQEKLKKHFKVNHKIFENELSDEYLNNRVDQLIQIERRHFLCFHCVPSKEFQSQDQLANHFEESHEGKLPADSLGVMQQRKSTEFKVMCKNGNPPMEFGSINGLVSHAQTNHEELKLWRDWTIERSTKNMGPWNCSECPVSYSRKQSLYYHMREKHNHPNLGGLKCPEPDCSESFVTNRQLVLHGISVHQKYFAHFHKVFRKIFQPVSEEEENKAKNFECDRCQKKYIYKTSLKKHIFTSHLGKSAEDKVVCSYCGKTLTSKLNLKSHIEFLHEAIFVPCPICKKKINFRTIGKHYKTHRTDADMVYSKNSFLCNLCGKILKSKRSFEDHQKLHKNIRDELCDICGSGFTTKKFLRLHKKTHEGIQRKVFGCDQCDKVFSGRHTLNRHLLTHSGKKNFICEICSKCFYTLQELNRHVRYHKKEYRFDCQLCDMRFLDKSRFRHHMMRHRNVRPHKCQFCEKKFIVRGKMNLHMAAKHNVAVQSTKGVWKDPKTYVPLDDLL